MNNPFSIALYIFAAFFLVAAFIDKPDLNIIKAIMCGGLGLMSAYYYSLNKKIEELKRTLEKEVKVKEVKNGRRKTKKEM